MADRDTSYPDLKVLQGGKSNPESRKFIVDLEGKSSIETPQNREQAILNLANMLILGANNNKYAQLMDYYISQYNINVLSLRNFLLEKGVSKNTNPKTLEIILKQYQDTPLESSVNQAYQLTREQMQGREIWTVSVRANQGVQNLIQGNILSANQKIDVACGLQEMGMSDKSKSGRYIQRTPAEGKSYETVTSLITPEIEEEIIRIKNTPGKKVVVLAQYPNQGFSKLVEDHGVEDRFTFLSPVFNKKAFEDIDNKLNHAVMMDAVLAKLIKDGKPEYNNNRINWAKMLPKTLETFNQLSQNLNLKSGQGVYIQKALSYGGEGTKRVENQQELQNLLQKEDWQTELQAGTLKATAEIVGAYPSNGEACIIPDGKGGCTVVLGKPSLKPVNPETNSGMGNDWGYQLSPSLQKQYTDIVTLIGKYLHKEYGYTGMFGPDCMVVSKNPKDPEAEQTLYINEVNARQQGTTDKQTENAVASNRIPIELLNHLVKLAGNDQKELKKVLDLVGNPNEYNRKVLDEKGGFYIKIFGPKEGRNVTKDITGAWAVITDANGKMDLKKVPDSFYLSRQIVSPGFNIKTSNSEKNPVIWVTGPKIGDEVSKAGGSPCAYILGSEIQVFEQTGPEFTKTGKLFFDKISQEMFK